MHFCHKRTSKRDCRFFANALLLDLNDAGSFSGVNTRPENQPTISWRCDPASILQSFENAHKANGVLVHLALIELLGNEDEFMARPSSLELKLEELAQQRPSLLVTNGRAGSRLVDSLKNRNAYLIFNVSRREIRNMSLAFDERIYNGVAEISELSRSVYLMQVPSRESYNSSF